MKMIISWEVKISMITKTLKSKGKYNQYNETEVLNFLSTLLLFISIYDYKHTQKIKRKSVLSTVCK